MDQAPMAEPLKVRIRHALLVALSKPRQRGSLALSEVDARTFHAPLSRAGCPDVAAAGRGLQR